jgi:transposase InsO family protein
MSKARVIVLSVVQQGLTKAEAARKFDVSWQWVHTLVTRYEADGLDGLEPRSRAPRTNPASTTSEIRDRVIHHRRRLAANGLDAGPVTIAWHLEREGITPPAISTIRRIITTAGLVTPEPDKRPRSSYHRFEADQPNETWQSDFTHWALADGTDIEILNWLDDHSRLLLSCTTHCPVTGTDVVDTFTRNINEYGPPASTLTDNGAVYTAKFRGGKNSFEYLIASLGIIQKNGQPYHPQTQGKIERFHQTLKRWLGARPAAANIAELQNQLNQFQVIYNQQRPHRALDHHTPQQAYDATIKAAPDRHRLDANYRVRHDIIDRFGKISLRRAGTMHHLGVGRNHTGKSVLILTDNDQATVTDQATGEILGIYLIEPNKNYWRDQTKEPGRWPGSS